MTTTTDANVPKSKGAEPSRLPRSRWRRRLIVLGAVVALVVAFHGPILRFLGGLLITTDPLIKTDAVVMIGRSGPYRPVPIDEIANLYESGFVKQILLIEDRSSRIVNAGVVPTLETVLTRELSKRQIPAAAMTTVASEFRSGTDVMGALGEWLKEHPDAHVTLLCSQFHSRHEGNFVRRVLEKRESDRIHWHALPDQRYDGSNWWHSRHGILEVVGAYVSLLYGYAVGEPAVPAPQWNADDYERKLSLRVAP